MNERLFVFDFVVRPSDHPRPTHWYQLEAHNTHTWPTTSALQVLERAHGQGGRLIRISASSQPAYISHASAKLLAGGRRLARKELLQRVHRRRRGCIHKRRLRLRASKLRGHVRRPSETPAFGGLRGRQAQVRPPAARALLAGGARRANGRATALRHRRRADLCRGRSRRFYVPPTWGSLRAQVTGRRR